MSRGVRWLLCATLLVWRPLDFAIELPSTLSSLGLRGVPGVVELLFHGAVAALAVILPAFRAARLNPTTALRDE